jgi:hypothetical protein
MGPAASIGRLANSFMPRRDDGFDVNRANHICRIAGMALIATLALSQGLISSAVAGPPAYLVLRRAESPGKHYQQGHYDAAMYDARTSGYAYGFFGAAPRAHSSRHFGIYRTYTQWSFW